MEKKVAKILFFIIMIIIMIALTISGAYQLAKEWKSIFKNDKNNDDI